jgi:hypothetical protein
VTTKRRRLSQEEAEELVGGGSLLDRIGRKEPIIPTHKPNPSVTKLQEHEEELMKLSLYLTPQEVNDLDRLVMKQRLETGRSPRRNQLIREAIQAYIAENSKAVN